MNKVAIRRLSLFTSYGEYACHWRGVKENEAASNVLLYYTDCDSIIWC